MAGGTLNGSHGTYDVYLVKVDSVGIFVWETDLGGSYLDWAYSISQTAGGYIVAGYTGITSGTTGRDLYIIKTDESGNAIWERNFGGSNQDVGYSVCEVSSGGYIVSGMSCRDNYIADLYLVKTDVNGVLEWEKTYGLEDENEIAKAVLETSDGGFIYCRLQTRSRRLLRSLLA